MKFSSSHRSLFCNPNWKRNTILAAAGLIFCGAVASPALAANIPPDFQDSTLSGRAGEYASYQLRAVDYDGGTVSFSVEAGSALPAGLQLNSSGAISGFPQTRAASFDSRIVADDGQGGQTVANVTFKIAEISSLVVNASEEGTLYDGLTSLGEAINNANANINASPITFDLPEGSRTVLLDKALPEISTPLSIIGPITGTGVTIARNPAGTTPNFRIFSIYGAGATGANSVDVSFSNLLILGGNAGSSIDGNGGAIRNSASRLTITNCTFLGNVARDGSAIFNQNLPGTADSQTFLKLLNCTLTENTATGENGGAFFNNGGVANLESSTIVGNSSAATAAAGVSGRRGLGVTEIRSCIIAGNLVTGTGANGQDVGRITSDQGSSLTSKGYNLIGDGDAASVARFNLTSDFSGVADSALKLGPLVYNGGATPTIALLGGSPAINAGSTTLSTDQRGVARPVKGADIGAFEVENPTLGNSLVVTTLVDEDNGVSDPSVGRGTSLREAIDFANSNPDNSAITFNLPAGNRTFILPVALPELSSDLSITGPTTGGGVTLSRNLGTNLPAFRILTVNGKAVSLNNLNIQGGSLSSTGEGGGGILNKLGQLTMKNCTVANNSASIGGGLLSRGNGDLSRPTLILTNCTFAGNTASQQNGISGGGIANLDGNVILDSCTITGNQTASQISSGVGTGLTIYNGECDTRNTLIAGNVFIGGNPEIRDDIFIGGKPTSRGYNLIGKTQYPQIFASPGDQVGVTTANLKLGALADNGGPVPTIAILEGSPALNAGDTAQTTDARGISRPQRNADDIGAFEREYFAPVNASVSPVGGSSHILVARSIVAAYTDSDGADDITEARILINSSLSGANSLTGRYVNGKLYLADNGATNNLGGFAPGSANIISNSQGSLDCSKTTVTREGNTLTIDWNFTPSAGFAGQKNVYTLSRDKGGLQDGWDKLALWLVTVESNSAPTNISANAPQGSPEAATTIRSVHRDIDGAASIDDVRLLINNNLSSVKSLTGRYSQGKLYLLGNDNKTFAGGYAPGSPHEIYVEQGMLDCSKTTVTASGNDLIIDWSFTPDPRFYGVKNIYGLVTDSGKLQNGWDNLGQWLITQVPYAPINLIDNVNLVSEVGAEQKVTTSYIERNGAKTVVDARLIINSSLGAMNGLVARYHYGKLYLLSDDGTTWLGGFAPGSANVITNSQGSLDCSKTTIQDVSNTLQINWSFTASAHFLGQKSLYSLVIDDTRRQDGWDKVGTWTIGSAAAAKAAGDVKAPSVNKG